MKRSTIFAVAAVVAVVPLLGFTGCGGDRAKAKEYARNADILVASIEKTGESLGGEINEAFDAASKSIAAGETPDRAAFARSVRLAKGHVDSMLREAASARAEYKKISALRDADDYKEYASLRTRVIEANSGGLERLVSFLDGASARLSASPFDPISFQSFVMKFGEEMQATGEETGSLQKRAGDLKKRKGL